VDDTLFYILNAKIK